MMAFLGGFPDWMNGNSTAPVPPVWPLAPVIVRLWRSKLAPATTGRAIPAGGAHMPKFVIEREIPGAGQLTAADLQAISQKSCGVLTTLGPKIQWVQSFVTDDKVYCVYIAPNADIVREHAKQGGFPANRISQVRAVIDPTTSE